MSLRLGDEAPDFVQESTQGSISFHQWLGDSWGVLFSHPVDSHNRCINDINETQLTQVNLPILADADRKASNLNDMIYPNANATLTVRSLFIIDPAKKLV